MRWITATTTMLVFTILAVVWQRMKVRLDAKSSGSEICDDFIINKVSC